MVTKKQFGVLVLVLLLVCAVGYIANLKYSEYQDKKTTDLSADINSSFINGSFFGTNNLAVYLVQNNEFPRLKFVDGNFTGFDLIDLNKYCGELR